MYSVRGWDVFAAEFFRIPAVEYGLVLLLALMITGFVRLLPRRTRLA